MAEGLSEGGGASDGVAEGRLEPPPPPPPPPPASAPRAAVAGVAGRGLVGDGHEARAEELLPARAVTARSTAASGSSPPSARRPPPSRRHAGRPARIPPHARATAGPILL